MEQTSILYPLLLLFGACFAELIIVLPDSIKQASFMLIVIGSFVVGLVSYVFKPKITLSIRWSQRLLDQAKYSPFLSSFMQQWNNQVAFLAAQKTRRLLLFLSGLALMYVGQIQIFRNPSFFPSSLSFALMLAGLHMMLILINIRMPTDSAPIIVVETVDRLQIRWKWLVLSIGLFCFVAWRSTLRQQEIYAGEHIVCWFLAIVTLLLAVTSGKSARVNDAPIARYEYALLLALFIAAFAIRGINLDKIPAGMDTDEADYAQEGAFLYHEHFLFSPFEPGALSQPRFYQGMVAVSVALFGQNLWGARLPSVLLGALTIPFMYLLARELTNRHIALIAALFMMTWAFHIQFSRLGLNLPGDLLFSGVAFYFLLRAMRLGSVRDYAMAGIAVGIAQLFWLGGRLLPLVIIAYLFYLFIRQPKVITSQWKLIGVMILAGFLVSLPQNVILLHFQYPITSIATVNIFVGGEWNKVVASGDAVPFIVSQVYNSFLALVMVNDNRTWYGEGSNLMGPIGGPMLVIGVVMSLLVLWKYPKWSLPLGWGLAVILGGSTFSGQPPSYERYVPGALAFSGLVAMGVSVVAFGIAKIWKAPQLYIRMTLGIGITLCIANLLFYEIDYVASKTVLFRYLNWRDNTLSEAMLAAYNTGEQVIVVGGWNTNAVMNRITDYFMMGKPFLVFENELDDRVTQIDSAKPFAIIVAPQRKTDLEALMAKFPGGRLRQITYSHDNSLALYVYEKQTTG